MYKLCKTEESAKRQREIELVLFDMMKDTPLDQISITELCERADIPRKTFYRYFDSKRDALGAFLDHTMAEYSGFDKHSSSKHRSLRRELEAFFDFWFSKREILSVFERDGLLYSLIKSSIRFPIADRISIGSFLPNVNTSNALATFKFAISGLVCLMIEWYHEGFATSSADMATLVGGLISKPIFPNLADHGIYE